MSSRSRYITHDISHPLNLAMITYVISFKARHGKDQFVKLFQMDIFSMYINELINSNTVLYVYFVCYEIQFSDNRINIASYEQRDELWLVNIIAVFFKLSYLFTFNENPNVAIFTMKTTLALSSIIINFACFSL